MKKILVFLLFLSVFSTTVWAQEITPPAADETVPQPEVPAVDQPIPAAEPTETVKEDPLKPRLGTFDPILGYQTYIPIGDDIKAGLYYTLKSADFALTFSSLMIEFAYPVSTDVQFQLFAENLYGNYCHQWKSRSFVYDNDIQMPLCARCFGINMGLVCGLADSYIWDSFEIKGMTRWQKRLMHIGLYGLLMVPLVADGFYQKNNFNGYVSTNGTRFVTGFLYGYAWNAIIDEAVRIILDYDTVEKKPSR